MFKVYRYIFYRFYKLAKKAEGQWPVKMRMPAFTANLFLVFFSIFISSSLFLKLTPINSLFWLVFLLIPILVFFINYFFIVRTRQHEVDDIEFDNAAERPKRFRSLVFMAFIASVFVFFIYTFRSTSYDAQKALATNIRRVKIGMSSNEVLNIMGIGAQRYISPENSMDSIYYYEYTDGKVKGTEVYINSQTHKVKWIKHIQ